MKSDRLFPTVLLIIIVVSLSFIAIASMRFYYYEQNSNFSSYALLLCTVIAFGGLVFGKIAIKSNSILLSAIIYSLVTLFFLVGEISRESMINKVHIILSVLSIPVGIIIGDMLGSNTEIQSQFQLTRFDLFIIPLLVSVHLFNSLGVNAPDSVFIILLLLPLVFFARRDALNLICFILVGYCCLQTAKRSVIIVFGLILLLYFIYFRALAKKKTVIRGIVSILLATAFAVSAVFILKNNSADTDRVIERFDDIDESGGSGRQDMYVRILEFYEASSAGEKMFGHGFDAVKEQVLGISAHNDFLEVLYDYGVFSAILYIIVLFRIILLEFRLFRFQPQLKFEKYMLGVILSLLLVLSMLNCIITSPFYVFLIFLELGLTISSIKNKVDGFNFTI